MAAGKDMARPGRPAPHVMRVQAVLAWCFPKAFGEESQLGKLPAAALLDLLANFGPLDAEGRLVGGRVGRDGKCRAMTAQEITQMASDLYLERLRQQLPTRPYLDDLLAHLLDS